MSKSAIAGCNALLRHAAWIVFVSRATFSADHRNRSGNGEKGVVSRREFYGRLVFYRVCIRRRKGVLYHHNFAFSFKVPILNLSVYFFKTLSL